MFREKIKKYLRLCYITDNTSAPKISEKQVKTALKGGATMVRYLIDDPFSALSCQDAENIRNICRSNSVPFIITGSILFAKAVKADGVLLRKNDETPETARTVLGDDSILGISIESPDDIKKINFKLYDYIDFPILNRDDKIAFPSFIQDMAKNSGLPLVLSGRIDFRTAELCFNRGASGVAVKAEDFCTENTEQNIPCISSAAGTLPRTLSLPWKNEFDLIEKLMRNNSKNIQPHHLLKVPSGDDAALLNSLSRPVITTDTQREGIHFKFGWQTPEEIGEKSVEAAFSDLAASYAVPLGLFINLGIPPYISDEIIEKIYKGIRRSLSRHNAFLGGGNISGSDSLSLDLFAIGKGDKKIFPVRSGASAGDSLYSTGPLGLAHTGLMALQKRDSGFNELRKKFILPRARFDAALILAKNRVGCVMDISDGLAGDALHIARASNITIRLDLSSCSFDPLFTMFCKKYNISPEATAICGGEDYELLFACSTDKFDAIKKEIPGAFKVGTCMDFNGEHIIIPFSNISSFQHGG